MKTTRSTLLHWAEQGRISPEDLQRALTLTGTLPTATDWRDFLDQLLLWYGTMMLGVGIIFFFSYNWNDLGRYTKFGLVEALMIAGLIALGWLEVSRLSGKAALLGLSLLVGVLFVLIGQTYQTGADTFELFALWAAAILPWVLVARFAALWIFWLALVNLATILYYQTFDGLFGMLFAPEQLLWVLLILNTTALVLWEGLVAMGVAWLHERWAARVLATAAAGLATVLALYAILDEHGNGSLTIPVWLTLLATVYFVYRQRMLDVYVLALGMLSVIMVVTIFLGKHMLDSMLDAGGLLFIGLVVIGLSGGAGWWLKQVVAKEVS